MYFFKQVDGAINGSGGGGGACNRKFMVINRTDKCQLLYLLVTFLATGVSTCVLIMTLEVGWITSLDASHLRIITSVFFLPFSICSLPGVKFTGLNLLLFTGHKSKMEGH